jgi:hypothetical protein
MGTAIITAEDAGRFVTPVVSSVVAQAQSLTVETGEDYELACMFLQGIAGKKKQVEEVFGPIVKKAHEAHKEACSQMKKFMDPLALAEADVKRKVIVFRDEQERLRRAEEARLAEIARKEQEQRAIDEAAQLEANGEKELAEIVLQDAASAPAPVAVVPSFVPKSSGISGRVEWTYRITDESKIPREYLMVNEVALRAVVRAQKNMAKIPGVQVFPKSNISVKAG